MNLKIPSFLIIITLLMPIYALFPSVKADFYKTSFFADVTAAEAIASQYGVDSRDLIYNQLSAIYGTYGISCLMIHLHFGIFPDTTLSTLTSKMQSYVSYFHSRVFNLIVSIAKVKHTGSIWTDSEIDQWYSGIAGVLNQYSSVKLFIGEYELCANNTCPICGKESPQKTAFQNNFANLKNYGIKLHQKWHQFSNIPFAISESLPWSATSDYIYPPLGYVHGNYWFGTISKLAFESYILGVDDCLTFTIWNNCDSVSWLTNLAQSNNRQIVVSEINMPYELGLSNVLNALSPYLYCYCWYDLINYNKIVLYDWACENHLQTNSKYNWFAVGKALKDNQIPDGSKFAILSQCFDRATRNAYYYSNQPLWQYYASQTVYAQKSISVSTSVYRALEVNVYFDAISYSDTYPENYICFARAEVDSSRWFSIGAKVWVGGSFDIVYEWVGSNGAVYSVSAPFGADSYNKWLDLKIYQSGSTIVIVCNSWTQTFNNGYTGSLTFTKVKFGDWNNKVVCTMLVDGMKIWKSNDNGASWSAALNESFESGLGEWSINVAGQSNPRATNYPMMLIADDCNFIDHASIYPLTKVY